VTRLKQSRSFARAAALEIMAAIVVAVVSAVAVATGLAVRSVPMVAFGCLGALELVPAGVRAWRFTVDAVGGLAVFDPVDDAIRRIVRLLYAVLATYALVDILGDLVLPRSYGASLAIGALIATLAGMASIVAITASKRTLLARLPSRALRASVREARDYLLFAVALTLLLFAHALAGGWWLDALADCAFLAYAFGKATFAPF
jgi:hypothetical protein